MASLQASNLVLSSSSKQIHAAISVPKLPSIRFSVPKVPATKLLSEELNARDGFISTVPIEKYITRTTLVQESSSFSMATIQLYALLEAVADRVEMHSNIGEQRENWNTLLLNSINMITLTAATMAGVTATGGAGASNLVLSSSSKQIHAAISVPKLPSIRFSVPKVPATKLLSEELNARDGFISTVPIEKYITRTTLVQESSSFSMATIQLYALLEAVADRVEMHSNIGEQRENWNTLLLNSINMITLTAATMAGVTATGGAGVSIWDPEKRPQLDWKTCFEIISGIARGLLYLHEDSRLKIIHRDLKPSNVLLDQDMVAKISDFGMARIFCENQNSANTKRVVGTYGYMAPEYAMEGLFSVKSDVFSFGVIVLEILCGQKNSGFYLTEHAQTLLAYAWQIWREGKELEIVDPFLLESCSKPEINRCFHVGLLCVQEDPADRPTMSDIVVVLGSDTDTIALPEPKRPAFSVGRVIAIDQSSMIDPSMNQMTVSDISAR
ncbi:Serine-threonine/tyrosine-protein kinase [Theobroma cacao]|nr:Serine-threonine/tyrosine-protein kinase [Theobroma cacao]